MVDLPYVGNTICHLRKCRKRQNLGYAKRVHACICNNGLEIHRIVGNYIVPMFVQCGSVYHAQQVFNRLVHRNEHSWTSLILGYIQCGQPQHALSLYQNMQEDNVHPSRYTLMALLKACVRLKDLEKGRETHVKITQQGFERDLFVGNTLVDMYAKCGSLLEARTVFERLPLRDVVSWNALIAGYAEHGFGEEALKCFEHMQLEGILPNAVTFVCSLKACGSIGALSKGREMHIKITQTGFERDPFVGNTLVDMYAKCGSLLEAREVFGMLPAQDVVSWTALIAGYTEHGPCQEALKCYEQMQLVGITPDAATFICVLKACGSIGDLDKGRELHVKITQNGFERDIFVGSTLVDMYAKCGLLSEAQQAFDKLPVRDVVSWNALIAGYAEHGPGEEALKCFEQMQLKGIFPNAITFVCSLKACGSITAIDKGRELHAEIRKRGFETDLFVCNTLIDMYAKCGLIPEAQEVFDKLPVHDVVSWTALIAGYAEHGPCEEALKRFEQMQVEGISPNAATLVCVLKACSTIGDIERGQKIHMEMTQKGFEREPFVCNTLIDMYAKCGLISEARDVFEMLPFHDVVSWNALIAGYAEHGPCQETLECFERMQQEGVPLDTVTLIYVLKACSRLHDIDTGRKVHAMIVQKGFERDLLVSSTLVDMYAKCGSLTEAEKVFDKLPIRDVVSWTALIAGYAEHGPSQEALKCFEQMQLEGICPDAVTFVCVLKVCGCTGAIQKGRELHTEIAQNGFARDVFVGNTLVDMYARCGSLAEAQDVFDKLLARDVVAWSAMINAYGMNHEGNMAIQCFEDMQEQGLKPNAITFTCLLTACSRARLLFEGQKYFKEMRKEYGILPTMDHYTCMVDLLARSGHLPEAEKFLETMPCSPSIEMWTALLSACKAFGEAELGLRCFEQLVEIDSEYAAAYVLMANIYARAGRWEDAYRIESLRKHAGARKKPASALIEVNEKVHEFVVGNNVSKEISAMLEYLSSCMKEKGHAPDLDLVLKPISDEEKEAALCEHAEKLALAFGLLNTPQGQTLLVIKNMKMCNDCHKTSMIISRIERRKIIVRDGYCVHHFKDGSCSCGDVFLNRIETCFTDNNFL